MKKARQTKTARTASIVGGNLYFEDVLQCAVDAEQFCDMVSDGYTPSIRVVSLDTAWYTTEWVTFDTFLNDDVNVQMTLRREIRSGRGHWYAYRKVFGKLYKRYVGDDEKITQKRLLEIARALPG